MSKKRIYEKFVEFTQNKACVIYEGQEIITAESLITNNESFGRNIINEENNCAKE